MDSRASNARSQGLQPSGDALSTVTTTMSGRFWQARWLPRRGCATRSSSASASPRLVSPYFPRGFLYHVLRAAANDPAANLTWRRTLDMAVGGATGMLYLHTRSP